MRFDHPLLVRDLTAAGVAGLRAAVSVSSWAALAVLAHVGKVGHSAPLARMLGDNDGASGWKMARGMA